MRIFGRLILLCLCASLGFSSFAQTLIYLAPGTTTQLTKAPTTSTIYYGGGRVKFDPTFDFSGSKGLLYVFTISDPVQSNSYTKITTTDFLINFTNIGAYVYTATCSASPPTAAVTAQLITTPANRNTVSSIDISGLTPNTAYSCTLHAFGGTPTGPPSNSIGFVTPPCPLAAPQFGLPWPVSTTQTTADINWLSVTDPEGTSPITYNLSWTDGYGHTNATTTDWTSYQITGLEPSSYYTVSVSASRSDCTSPSTSQSFSTLPMDVPTLTLSSPPVGSNQAYYYYTISWNKITGATGYNYKAGGLLSWTTETSVTLSGSCQTTISHYVQAVNGSHSTNWSNEVDVTMPSCFVPGGRMASPSAENSPQINNSPDVSELTVSPNPTTDKVTLSLPRKVSSDTPLSIVDVHGAILSKGTITKGEWKTDVQLGGFPQGLYLIYVGGFGSTKIIVSH